MTSDPEQSVAPDQIAVLRQKWGIHFDLVRRASRGERGVPREIARRIRETLDGASVPDRRARHIDVAELAERMEPLCAGVPARRRNLDHVAATPLTAARRAIWLDDTWDLDGAHVVILGDRDLTSVALRRVCPTATVTVVDIDPDVCEYVDREGVRVRFADLRLGLPRSLAASADLVFTDPPYTAAGVALFARRGLEALRDRDLGRLALAYGFGFAHPGLGLKVQDALSRLSLVYESILPGFNEYTGAESLGSRSDLYVLRATSRTPSGQWTPRDARIYSHGTEATESAPAPTVDLAHHLEQTRTGGKPPFSLPHSGHLQLDLTGWESSLLAVVLSANASMLTVLGRKLDLLGTEDVLGVRWVITTIKGGLQFERRTTPAGVLGTILDHPRALVANTWREAIAPPLTRSEARAKIGANWSCHIDELAPHQLGALASAVAST